MTQTREGLGRRAEAVTGQRLVARRPWPRWLLRRWPGASPPFTPSSSTSQLSARPSMPPGRPRSLDGAGGSERVSPSAPGAMTQLTAVLDAQVTERRAAMSSVPSTGPGGRKSAFSQSWEGSSCQSGTLNELVMERKVPPLLNSGSSLLPNCTQLFDCLPT